LDNARRFGELACFGASAVEALARDRDGVMQVVQLFAVESNRFLAAPAEPFDPGRITQRDALRALVRLDDDFYPLIRGGRLKNMRYRIIT
jgi:hypothetical protein